MGFSVSRVPSPVCGLESCDLDIDSYRDGNRKQLRLWRISTDINLKILIRRYEGLDGPPRRVICLRYDKLYSELRRKLPASFKSLSAV
jgi:hypothetical protein